MSLCAPVTAEAFEILPAIQTAPVVETVIFVVERQVK